MNRREHEPLAGMARDLPWPPLSQLQHFAVLAEELNFTRAAHRVGLGQQGLSASIRAMERLLDTRLFVRSTRRVELTAAGQALLGPVRRALAELSAGLAAVHEIAVGQAGEIRLGVTVSGDFELISRTLAALQATHPRVQVSVTRGTTTTNLAALRAGDLDAALLRLPTVDAGDLRLEPLRTDDLGAVVTADDPLAGVTAVEPRDVRGRRMVLFPRDASPGLFDHLVSWLGKPAPGDVLERPDEEMIIREVSAGGGIGFTTAARAAEVAVPEVRWRPLRPALTSDLTAACRDRNDSPLLAPLLDALRVASRARAINKS